MKTNTITPASPWAAPLSARERFCIAPNASLQGTGVSAAYGTHMTVTAARKHDAQVPDPRGRMR